MESFSKFFIDNWQVILIVLLNIVLLVCSLLKRKVSSDLLDKIYLDVVNLLPSLINDVEHPGDGLSKKITVESEALKIIEKKLNRKLSTDEITVLSTKLSENIENILSTPQRKGD